MQPEPLLRGSTYHCQQATEKSLKGYLTWQDVAFPWTHDLERLVLSCETIDGSFSELMATAEFINQFATASRYPADQMELTYEEAQTALEMARHSLKFVLARLPEDVHPDPDPG